METAFFIINLKSTRVSCNANMTQNLIREFLLSLLIAHGFSHLLFLSRELWKPQTCCFMFLGFPTWLPLPGVPFPYSLLSGKIQRRLNTPRKSSITPTSSWYIIVFSQCWLRNGLPFSCPICLWIARGQRLFLICAPVPRHWCGTAHAHSLGFACRVSEYMHDGIQTEDPSSFINLWRNLPLAQQRIR